MQYIESFIFFFPESTIDVRKKCHFSVKFLPPQRGNFMPRRSCRRQDIYRKSSFIYLFILRFQCFIFFLLILFYLTLQYFIGFAIYQNESATGIHVFPILSPPPSSLPIPSLWVVPVHQPQASSIVHRTWTGDSFHT